MRGVQWEFDHFCPDQVPYDVESTEHEVDLVSLGCHAHEQFPLFALRLENGGERKGGECTRLMAAF